MKPCKFFLAFLVLILPIQICFAARNKDYPLLVDQFGRITCEELKASLDGYIATYRKHNLIANIVFYGETSNEGKNLEYIHSIKSYILRFSNIIDEKKLIFLRGENREEMLVQLWLIPEGTFPIKPEKEFVKSTITLTTKFDVHGQTLIWILIEKELLTICSVKHVVPLII